jgi:hypothetical protein
LIIAAIEDFPLRRAAEKISGKAGHPLFTYFLLRNVRIAGFRLDELQEFYNCLGVGAQVKVKHTPASLNSPAKVDFSSGRFLSTCFCAADSMD